MIALENANRKVDIILVMADTAHQLKYGNKQNRSCNLCYNSIGKRKGKMTDNEKDILRYAFHIQMKNATIKQTPIIGDITVNGQKLDHNHGWRGFDDEVQADPNWELKQTIAEQFPDYHVISIKRRVTSAGAYALCRDNTKPPFFAAAVLLVTDDAGKTWKKVNNKEGE